MNLYEGECLENSSTNITVFYFSLLFLLLILICIKLAYCSRVYLFVLVTPYTFSLNTAGLLTELYFYLLIPRASSSCFVVSSFVNVPASAWLKISCTFSLEISSKFAGLLTSCLSPFIRRVSSS